MCQITIKADSLKKIYSSTKALNNFSLEVRKGEFVALLGANGAGKSTFIRIALGLESPEAPPEGGNSEIFSIPSISLQPSDLQKIGYISSDMSPVPWAPVCDIADFYASIYHKWDVQLFENYIRQWSLLKNKKLKDLSKGQRRLSEFALVLSYHPELLILDEPFDGLDAVNRINLQKILKELQKKTQVTILYTTHVLEEVHKLADRLVIIREGKKVYDQPLKESTESIEVIFRKHYGMAL
ncbi:MAG: ABC transporter ATP-binding protein [Chitinispirillaceae bacterium]|nr:ABC transporter ATP-binding protein [Chitinispirillaceae bacterium]